jgi:hypothetical protein
MCRAILEDALREIVDPHGVIEQQVKGSDSYIMELVREAERRDILSDDRPDWAHRIRRAGNLAVHDLKRFKLEFPDNKFEELLLNTRKILEDLYAVGENA